MTKNYLDIAKLWTSDSFDENTREEVTNLIATNAPDLEDRFYKNLEFGTGGMRGIMGVGTNRLNKYTLGQATQGLATYLKSCYKDEEIIVAIAYDVRHNSREFGQLVADVLSGNGIRALLFHEHRPTPELSFTVRDKKCHAGIVLTASHNPPEYNGYKVYWNDGAQVVPPHDKNIIDAVYRTEYQDIIFKANESLIEYVDDSQDERYISACITNSLYQKDKIGYQDLKIVFTSIHGTTYTTIPKAFSIAGFTKVDYVEEQMIPSGNFPTVESPNPEEPEALSMAVHRAEMLHSDIVIGTDPDGDRLGIAVRNLSWKMQLLNGNQCNTILTYYILDEWKKAGRITGNEFIASTIVTSDIFFAIAERFGVKCKAGLTGFKWIGKMIRDAETEGKEKFICGGEESFGFMTGDFVRDKDSCGSILLACEIAALCKSKGSSLFEYLIEIYKELGFYYEGLINITKKGKSGAEEILSMMKKFRNNPPTVLGGSAVVRITDYEVQKEYNFIEDLSKEHLMDSLPKSNVLVFYTADGTKVCARPSGTEPKIKFYISVKSEISDISEYDKKVNLAEEKIEQIRLDLEL